MKKLVIPTLAVLSGALLLAPATTRADELLKFEAAAPARDMAKDRVAGAILPPTLADKIYLLQMRLRGTEELPLTFGVRDAGEPYVLHWKASPLIKSHWQN